LSTVNSYSHPSNPHQSNSLLNSTNLLKNNEKPLIYNSIDKLDQINKDKKSHLETSNKIDIPLIKF